MRIVVAPDKFKECLSAAAVADAIAIGLRTADPGVHVDLCPVADGGEGTVDALVRATGGRIITRTVTGPLAGMKVAAEFGILGDKETAVIEMAAASGLRLLKPEHRNPMRTTTYGTGELLRAAADMKVRRIILGIGGSATVDGGVGAAQAWGARIELENGNVYSARDRKLTGADVASITSIDMGTEPPRPARTPRRRVQPLAFGATPADTSAPPPPRPALPGPAPAKDKPEIIVACDVTNPLFGPSGAAHVFGPQKGASPEQVRDLDDALRKLAHRTAPSKLAETPGAGAAGGLGFGMLAYFGATLRSGIEIVIDAVRLRERLRGADLCITGEGRLDSQSLQGKAAIGVARVCREMKIPCIALAGALGDGVEAARDLGLSAWFSICDRPAPARDCMANAPRLLAQTAENMLRAMRLGK